MQPNPGRHGETRTPGPPAADDTAGDAGCADALHARMRDLLAELNGLAFQLDGLIARCSGLTQTHVVDQIAQVGWRLDGAMRLFECVEQAAGVLPAGGRRPKHRIAWSDGQPQLLTDLPDAPHGVADTSGDGAARGAPELRLLETPAGPVVVGPGCAFRLEVDALIAGELDPQGRLVEGEMRWHDVAMGGVDPVIAAHAPAADAMLRRRAGLAGQGGSHR